MDCYLAQHQFDKICQQYPNKPGIYFSDNQETFEELYVFTNRIARSLKRAGVKRGDRIAITMPKSISAVKAMLGVLKADAIYVPVNCKAPMDRLNEILEDCSPAGILTDKSTIAKINESAFMRGKKGLVWDLEGLEGEGDQSDVVGWREIVNERADELDYANIDTDIAYIIYTSGSTGKPKGVMITHKNLDSYIKWAINFFDIRMSDNILNTSHFYYDMSIFDIFCATHTGASLTIMPEESLIFPSRIMDTIERRECTIWKAASSLLGYCVKCNSLRMDRIRSLQKVIFSGEALPSKVLLEWIKAFPEKDFFNAYGPTECTGISSCYRVEKKEIKEDCPIPIGWACKNSEMIALDEEGKPAAVGKIGELYIRGSSVGAGYWMDLEKTGEQFIRRCFNAGSNEIIYRTGDYAKQMDDGKFVFVGRRDCQVKVMGYRIELGEIETVLQDVKGVREAVVFASSEAGEQSSELVAVIEGDGDVVMQRISGELRKRLPKHMIPRKMYLVGQIQRLENGKIDRQYIRKHVVGAV